MLSAMDANGGIEVLSLYFDWRRLIEDPTKEATNPAEEATNLANEIRIDIALLDGFVSPNERWFERLALGVVSVDYYDVAVGREGETRVTEEAMSLLFDYGVIEGFRLWDAPWKIDATLGMSVVSPIAEVRRTPVDNPDGTVSVDYEGGPSTISPHLWAAVHHVAEGTDHGDGQSVIFEAIPADAVFGVGVGSFQRLDGSGMAADFGAQAAAYGRVPLSTNLTLRAEALAIIAERGAVSELTTDLPIKSGESFFMGRVDAGLDWSLGKHWLVSTTAWLEQSDRELSTADSSPLGPRARAGVRAGLYFTY